MVVRFIPAQRQSADIESYLLSKIMTFFTLYG